MSRAQKIVHLLIIHFCELLVHLIIHLIMGEGNDVLAVLQYQAVVNLELLNTELCL